MICKAHVLLLGAVSAVATKKRMVVTTSCVCPVFVGLGSVGDGREYVPDELNNCRESYVEG